MLHIVSVKVDILEKESVKIYRMSTLDPKDRPIMWVSSYLIDGLLIDFGHYHAKDSFLELLDFDEIEMCVLSHHHEDHIGACYDLVNKYETSIYGTKETLFLVRQKIRIPPERMLTWGLPKPFKGNLLPNQDEINTSKAKFKIIPSPGHCRNLISFFHIKKQILFSTDAFIDEKQNVIFNWENATQMLDTFNKFKILNPRYIFLEDGRVITIKELNNLLEIFGKESWLKAATGGDMSRENLVRSLLKLPPVFKRRIRKKV